MGRPINKRYFGGIIGADGTAFANNIPVQSAFIGGHAHTAHDGSAELYIIKQKSARRFVVYSHDDQGISAVCRLTDAANVDDSTQITEGEMVVVGFYNGQAKTIRSLTNKIATDFSGVRYKWAINSAVGDDSATTNVIILTLP
jgi:hypothetical protein